MGVGLTSRLTHKQLEAHAQTLMNAANRLPYALAGGAFAGHAQGGFDLASTKPGAIQLPFTGLV